MADIQGELISFGNAVNALNAAINTNDLFLAHCAKNSNVRHDHAPLEVNIVLQTIGASAFGRDAAATARTVLGASGFATEYVFVVHVQGESVEVWRCYLGDPSGSPALLCADADLKNELCLADNLYVSERIFAGVAAGIKGRLFTPTPLPLATN